MSILNTRFSLCIQVIDWWRSAGVLSSQFSPPDSRRLRSLPLFAGVTRRRSLLFGALVLPAVAGGDAQVSDRAAARAVLGLGVSMYAWLIQHNST
jgi:hypothetical protein